MRHQTGERGKNPYLVADNRPPKWPPSAVKTRKTKRTKYEPLAASNQVYMHWWQNKSPLAAKNWYTFGALVATASAAILAMLVAHCDTDTTISALQTQADTMRDQLNEMRGDKRAWISASKLDIRQNWGAGETPDDYVQVVVTMYNTGREPAVNVSLSVATLLFYITDVKGLEDPSTLLQTTDISFIKKNDTSTELHPLATGLTIYPAALV